MDFLSLVKQRQSDRAFDPERSVEPEKLERILEGGRLAPSSCNSQPWHFIVVEKSCSRCDIESYIEHQSLYQTSSGTYCYC